MHTINEITKELDCEIYGNPEIKVTGISYDSREIKPGNIFVAIKGEHVDGKDFIFDAIRKGAKVIVSDNRIDNLPSDITLIVVKDTLKSLSVLSSNFYDNPSLKLNIIGVTGTNGKTTITYLVESIYKAAGIPIAVIGTINNRFNNEIIRSKNTTPLSSELQFLLNYALTNNIKDVVMEVSSHSLVLERVTNCEFDIGIFTNLSREHLDYHKTLDEYLNAKLKLFEKLSKENKKNNKKYAIVNIDDPVSDKIINITNVPVITYGLNKKSNISFRNIEMTTNKLSFVINFKLNNIFNGGPTGEIKINTNLLGRYNIYNIIASFACGVVKGIDIDTIRKGIEALEYVPGRLEKIDCGQKFTVIVDFAHTPAALENVLMMIKEFRPRKLITVFGCGGNRDRTKRPVMGEIAVSLSDYVIITSDNPREEDPEKIVLDIEVGIKRLNKDNYEVIIDREKAIERALSIANKNDFVLIAGKGHENYQIIGKEYIPFDDREIVKKYLSILKKKNNGKY